MLKRLIFPLVAAFGFSAFAADYKGLGPESVTPELLAKYAPPPLPPELSRKIQLMLDVRSPSMGTVSPDGKKLFFTWRVTGTSQVWRLDRPNGYPVQMTGGEDRTSISDITPDGERLILSRDQGGEENPGLYWQAAAGGSLRPILHKAKVRAIYDFTSADSKHVYFHANDVAESSYAIYKYNLKTGQMERLFAQEGLWEIADHNGEREFLLAKRTGSLWTEYYLWHPGDEKPVPVLGVGEKEEYEVRFSPRSGEYLVLTPKFGEYRRLYSLKNGMFTPISPEMSWDVATFSVDQKRTRIYYETNEQGYSRLAAVDARTFKPLRVPKFAGAEHVYFGYATPDGRFFSLGVETAQAPRTAYVYDWKMKKQTQWMIPSAPEVNLSAFARSTLEYYDAEDGTKIPMFVRRSKKCEQEVCPVIVNFHGGPEGQSRPYFSAILQMFVDAGFVWVEPNVRGSDGYGKSWLSSDNGEKRLKVLTDIRDCADYIKARWARDGVKPKVGVFGGSYGGYSTQVAMTIFAGHYDAGFSVVGMSNLVTFLRNTAPYRRLLRITEYGDPDKDAEVLKKLSPINYVSQVKAPLFLLQGLNDPRVPAGEAIQMHETLVKKGIPSQLVIFADEGHGAAKRDNQVRQFGYALGFFEKYLRTPEAL